jgi:hypothetical protein
MRYSKLEISRRCHFWVMLEFLISCRGDIMEARLKQENTVTAAAIRAPSQFCTPR